MRYQEVRSAKYYDDIAKELWVSATEDQQLLMWSGYNTDPNQAWLRYRASFTNGGGSLEDATWLWSSLENLMHKEMEE